MTEDQICNWLGLPPGSSVLPAITRRLAEVGVPLTDEDKLAAFGAFLEVAGPAPVTDRAIPSR